jgi:5-methyltetrahydrofolate--homocysteine methyltransferase
VVNLGIKVAPEVLIAGVREHRPDVVGLSGLLVKSAQQMVVTAGDMHDAGIELPILVGGAALTNKFTRTRIAPAYDSLVAYAKDAMTGLDLMAQLMDVGRRRSLSAALAAETAAATAALGKDGDGAAPAARPAVRSKSVRADLPIPPVPDLDRHLIEPRLDEVWAYMNPQMLYGRHLGLRGDFDRLRAAKDPKALALEEAVEAVKAEARAGAMKVRAIWQFFEAESEGNTIRFYRGAGAPTPAAAITFPRQAREPGLCLADFVLPARGSSRDHVALFVTTAGAGIRELAEEAKQKGEYLRSHALQALALETAEAAAEWLPREALLVRLSGMSGARRSGGLVGALASGGDRGGPDRGLHDGSRGQRLGARLPASRRDLFRDCRHRAGRAAERRRRGRA